MTSGSKELVIVGAGGAGLEALWVASRVNEAAGSRVWNVVGFVDDNPMLMGKRIKNVPVLGTSATVSESRRGAELWFHIAIGSNRQRQRQAELWEAAGFQAAALIDPSAIVAADASVGAGSYLGPLVVVAPLARVGRHVLINSHVGVGHHAVIGDFVQLCPGVRVNGGCKIDTGAFLGSNSVVHPGQSIGEYASIGANSFVIRSVKPRFSMLGVPARIVSRPASNGPDAQA